MLAYAFLAKGAREPLSAFVWPLPGSREPGPWVDLSDAPNEALRGYAPADLPYWLDEELWTIELTGALTERDHLLLAERARLVSRLDSWTDSAAWEFVTACARRVARQAAAALREEGRADAALQLEEATDLAALESAALAVADGESAGATFAGYVTDVCFYARDASTAAHAAGIAAKMAAYALAGDASDPAGAERLANERAWQADWLVDRLGLSRDDRVGDGAPDGPSAPASADF